jgi:GDP-L-fucose synthase
LWGTGAARREFIHVDDLADACLFLLDRSDDADIINVGTGVDHSIREIAELAREIVAFDGSIEWDSTKPDGMPRKLMDVSRLHDLGWHHHTDLREGIKGVVADFEARRGDLATSRDG